MPGKYARGMRGRRRRIDYNSGCLVFIVVGVLLLIAGCEVML